MQLACDVRVPLKAAYSPKRLMQVHTMFICLRHYNQHAVLHGVATPMVGHSRFASGTGGPPLTLTLRDQDGQALHVLDNLVQASIDPCSSTEEFIEKLPENIDWSQVAKAEAILGETTASPCRGREQPVLKAKGQMDTWLTSRGKNKSTKEDLIQGINDYLDEGDNPNKNSFNTLGLPQ